DAAGRQCLRSSCAAGRACGPARCDGSPRRSARRTSLRLFLSALEPLLLTCLSDLAADLLTLIADALALVGVALPQATDVGRYLADLLLVDSGDRELRRRLHRERDALRGGDQHRVAVSQGELQVASLGHHAVTDTEDLHFDGVAVGDSGD